MNEILSEILELKREVAPMKKCLDIVMADISDPWENIRSETDSAVRISEVMNLDHVSEYYAVCKKGQCMVLGPITHSDIVCAHIWPRQTLGKGLEMFGLAPFDLNSPRNFLRLHKTIEREFDYKRLTFLPVSVSVNGDVQMKMVILDPALLAESISYSNTSVKFESLQYKPFHYVFTPKKMPFTRLLSSHALLAYSRGKALGWPEALSSETEARESAVQQARRSLGEESFAIQYLFKGSAGRVDAAGGGRVDGVEGMGDGGRAKGSAGGMAAAGSGRVGPAWSGNGGGGGLGLGRGEGQERSGLGGEQGKEVGQTKMRSKGRRSRGGGGKGGGRGGGGSSGKGVGTEEQGGV
jgi:hypothetical protein